MLYLWMLLKRGLKIDFMEMEMPETRYWKHCRCSHKIKKVLAYTITRKKIVTLY